MVVLYRCHQFNQVQQSLEISANQRTALLGCSPFFNRRLFRPLILPLLGGISYLFSR